MSDRDDMDLYHIREEIFEDFTEHLTQRLQHLSRTAREEIPEYWNKRYHLRTMCAGYIEVKENNSIIYEDDVFAGVEALDNIYWGFLESDGKNPSN